MEELKEIRLLRKRLGLTQNALAKRSGVSQSLIAKVESGKIDPSYNNAKKIFETLRQIESKNDLLAKDLMNQTLITVSADDSIRSAIEKMRKYEISQLPVIDGQHAVGYVSESILLDNILKENSQTDLISEIMEDSPPIVPMDTSKSVIMTLLRQFPLVLVKRKEKLQGIITKSDLLGVVYK